MSKDKDNDMNELSPMRVAFIQLHEIYVELRASGFNRNEALSIVGTILMNGMQDG